MTAIRTRTITISLIESDVNMLEALATARNGSIHNVASTCLRHGVMAELAAGPAALEQRYMDALKAQRKEFEMQEGWQPIDTVPKDGTPVLLFVPVQELRHYSGASQFIEAITAVGRWYAGGHFQGDDAGWDVWPDDRGPTFPPEHPTHWMPLPQEPKG